MHDSPSLWCFAFQTPCTAHVAEHAPDKLLNQSHNITDGYLTTEGYAMGIAERKLREKNRRRSAILKTAKRLILKHGVEG